jgi:hypothetical protein
MDPFRIDSELDSDGAELLCSQRAPDMSRSSSSSSNGTEPLFSDMSTPTLVSPGSPSFQNQSLSAPDWELINEKLESDHDPRWQTSATLEGNSDKEWETLGDSADWDKAPGVPHTPRGRNAFT